MLKRIARVGAAGILVGSFASTSFAQGDTTPPQLTAFSFTPTTIDTTSGPASFTVNFTLTDDLSGATSIAVLFRSPSLSQQQFPFTGFNPPTTNVTGSFTATFPQFIEAGIWTVSQIVLADAVGNRLDLLTADLVAMGFPTELTVVSNEDTAAPQLTAFSFTPTTIDTTAGPANLTVNFTLTDDLSGATSIGVLFRSPSLSQQQFPGTGFAAATSVTGSFTATFPQFIEAGIWTVSQIFIADAAGNRVDLFTADLVAMGFPTELLVNTEPPVIEVEIDIQPGTFPNSINLKKNGVIPVAILSTGTFDATTVDPSTVRFGLSGPPPAFALEDVDRDGDLDMVFRFRTLATGIICGMTSVSLTGETLTGQNIEGSDSIRTVGCK